MKQIAYGVVTAAAISISGLVGSAAPAQAYQVDCAILLCLAGGWPASAPCAHARSVFIRRITPWPIEPPLQVWRCPMAVSFNAPVPVSPMKRIYDAAFRKPASASRETPFLPLIRVQADEQADVDISGDAFDFVRSIRVFHVQYSQRQNESGECNKAGSVRKGIYAMQGRFGWMPSDTSQVPASSSLTIPNDCSEYAHRSVLVEWRDHAGNYDFEEVHY